MCGIVGYIGKNVEQNLIENLKELEYRGYDSSGLAVINKKQILVNKAEGRILNLEKIVKNTNSTCGIAHTRWATNGKPSVENAHPHLSENNNYAVVHNGIIENSEDLKKNLNVIFKSETDTEVVAHMLENPHEKNTIHALINVCKKLKGSYALVILNRKEKNTLFLAKKKSPLYVSIFNKQVLVCSDPICFAGKTNEYYMLEDDEFCKATNKKLEFYDKNFNKITKTLIKNQTILKTDNKNSYENFMLKEIYETKDVLKRIVKNYVDNKIFNALNLSFLNKFNKIVLVGCGTAYHASLMGASFIEKFAKIECKTYIASEFRYSNPIIDEKTLCIFVSQSGETADTILSLEHAKSFNATNIALTNVTYSTLAKKSDFVFPIFAGPEIAVASTKAYTAQVAILYLLAKYFESIKFDIQNSSYKEILELSNTLEFPKQEDFKSLVDILKNEKDLFLIGKNLDYFTIKEASLKLKETTYINSSSYPAGELKHGFLALIEENSVLFVLATQKELLDKTLNSANEAFSRGAKIVLITQLNIEEEKIKNIFRKINLQNFTDNLMPIVSVIFFQLLSYYVSIEKGINPDKPRNLAKSVTVE